MPAGEGTRVGRVAQVWRYPVKSMQGERVAATTVTNRGALGDRAFALQDVETGKVASAKSPRLWPNLLDFSATFVEPPIPDRPLPPVRITLPSGDVVRTDEAGVEDALSAATGRQVRLITSNPRGATFEQYVPPIEGVDPDGTDLYRDTRNDLLGSGTLHDAASLHLLTDATLRQLASHYPAGHFDVRRFRPNIVIAMEDGQSGFVENNWMRATVGMGRSAARVTTPMLRCVMTTVAQQDLPKDLKILRTAVEHNRLQVRDWGAYPCVGVGARVAVAGPVAVDDPVTLRMGPGGSHSQVGTTSRP